MNKQEFLSRLRGRLAGLPTEDLEATLSYYAEMIDDRVEDGMSEEAAVAAIGTPAEIATKIIGQTPLVKIAKERVKPKRRLRAWEIVLIVLGSPVWAPLLLATAIVVLAVYIVLWTLVAVVWVVGAACAVGAVAGIACAVPTIFTGNVSVSLLYAGAGLVLAGLSIFAYIGARAATRGTAKLSKIIWFGLKRALVRKEAAA